MEDEKVCGAEHPEQPGVLCERVLCLEYHRNGHIIWTQGAQKMPTGKPNTVRMAAVVRRTKAKARRSDPQTSHQAAASVSDLTAAQEMVLEALRMSPMTDEEIFQALVRVEGGRMPMSTSGARTRRSELVDAGLVEDSGQTELTEAGRRTIVWRVKE